MTTFTVTFSLFAIIAVVMCKPGFDKAKMEEMAMQMAGVCAQKTQATAEDMAVMQKHEIPTTKTGKCFLECMLEGFGMMKDGKLHKEGLMQLGTQIMGDKIAMVAPMINECEQVPLSDDGCENAIIIMKCFEKFKDVVDIEALMG